MKKQIKFGELALSLQEARRRNPDAYLIISQISGIPVKRIKAVARGAEPEYAEKIVLTNLARG